MAKFITDIWDPLLYILGTILRPLGGLLFGALIGWITANTFLGEGKEWQVKIALILGVLITFMVLVANAGVGTAAFFALGAGIAGIVFLVRQMQPAKKNTTK